METAEIKQLQLGERVLYTGHLKRVSDWPSKRWMLLEHDGEGIVIGRRTLSNGHNVSLGEDGIVYVVDERFPVVLVSFALHRSPAIVPVSHVERAAGRWAHPSRPSPVLVDEPLFALEDFS
jgi:hypothetical protein